MNWGKAGEVINCPDRYCKSDKVCKTFFEDCSSAARVYPGFCSMKRLGVFLLLLDGMLVHRRYTPGRREALCELRFFPKNTTQCPWSGLETGSLDPGTRALKLRPPLHKL